jgi:Tol biopolymer transport system component
MRLPDSPFPTTGVLIYRLSTNTMGSLEWLDRGGRRVQLAGPSDSYVDLRLDPKAQRIAFTKAERFAEPANLWMFDLARQTMSKFTLGPPKDWFPLWSPDGRTVVFSSVMNGTVSDLFVKDAGGATPERLLLQSPHDKRATSWSNDPNTDWDVKLLSLDGGSSTTLLGERFSETDGQVSPDGQWLAYTSNESGPNEAYIQNFRRGGGNKWHVSKGGGRSPKWREDGKELFYLGGDPRVGAAADFMAVSIGTSRERDGLPTLDVGIPRTLFRANVSDRYGRTYDVTANGERFLVYTDAGRPASPINVIVNWTAALKK